MIVKSKYLNSYSNKYPWYTYTCIYEAVLRPFMYTFGTSQSKLVLK